MTDRPGQKVFTQIRLLLLLLEEQSDQGIHCLLEQSGQGLPCLPFCLYCLDTLLYGKATLFEF